MKKGKSELHPKWLASVTATRTISAIAIDAPDCICAKIEGNLITARGTGQARRAIITIEGTPTKEWHAPRWKRYTAQQYQTNTAFWASAHGKA